MRFLNEQLYKLTAARPDSSFGYNPTPSYWRAERKVRP